MIPKKYHSVIAVVIGSLLVTMSCDENSGLPTPVKSTTKLTNANSSLASYTFDGKEGDPITQDVASRWIANYTNKNYGAITAHFFGRKALENILAKSGCIGIRFYYAMDDSFNPNLLLIGADGSGQNFLSDLRARGKNSSVVLNAGAFSNNSLLETEEDLIATDKSNQWIANYNSTNPLGVQAHFFGNEILRQILSLNGCIGIRCYYALNDAGVQQLLLIGVTNEGVNLLPLSSSTLGRVADGGGTIADASFPCPTYCPPAAPTGGG
ncbi:MAG: hypothetical protein HY015_09835 [Bacteroidetes bacterium]|nr:hypothetical protein [Bacteroidota bacterium]MBI3483254.1 hypothetical protein [Bacteroidota bacterium]